MALWTTPLRILDRLALWLWVVVAGSLAWSLLVALTGGILIEYGPLYFSSRKPDPALKLAAWAAAGLLIHYRAIVVGPALRIWAKAAPLRRRCLRFTMALPETIERTVEQMAPWLAAGLALIVVVQAIDRGSRAAGGSDPWGYIAEAELIAQGTLHVEQPFARTVPWPNADWTFSPLGFRPATSPGAMVPTYPPGLPLVMALFEMAGGRAAVFLVVPLAAAVAVFATYLVGARLGGRLVGVLSAAWLGASPAFVFQTLQPMSDVPATAWWLLAALAATGGGVVAALLAGLAAGLGILTRPNLLFLAVPFGVYLLAAPTAERRSWKTGLTRTAVFACGVLAACLVVAWINNALYGSPLASGYGSLEDLYAFGHLSQNVSQFSGWLLSTQSPLILACVLAPFFGRRDAAASPRPGPAMVALLLAIAAVVWVSYLFYQPFDAWWYLRFLLPALPPMIILAVFVIVRGLSRLHVRRGPAVAVLGFVPFLAWQAFTAAELTYPGFRDGEHKYQAVGEYVERALPAGSVLISLQHSGSLRYYAGELTLRYDWLAPDWLDDAIEFLREEGYEVFIVVEDWEEDRFRDRFAGSSDYGRLDWPPAAEFNQPNASTVRIFDPRDRARYLAGERIDTRPIPGGVGQEGRCQPRQSRAATWRSGNAGTQLRPRGRVALHSSANLREPAAQAGRATSREGPNGGTAPFTSPGSPSRRATRAPRGAAFACRPPCCRRAAL